MDSVFRDHDITTEKVEYWNTLSAADRKLNRDRVLLHYCSKGDRWLEAMAINAAWDRSPVSRARVQAEHDAYWTEELTCSRSGHKVGRNEAVTFGKMTIAQSALTAEEKAFLRI